jgi:beta-glucanase (GH16 family)
MKPPLFLLALLVVSVGVVLGAPRAADQFENARSAVCKAPERCPAQRRWKPKRAKPRLRSQASPPVHAFEPLPNPNWEPGPDPLFEPAPEPVFEPTPTEPAPTELTPAEPAPSEPAPEPTPTEPMPTEPTPTQPTPTEPTPMEPTPMEPMEPSPTEPTPEPLPSEPSEPPPSEPPPSEPPPSEPPPSEPPPSEPPPSEPSPSEPPPSEPSPSEPPPPEPPSSAPAPTFAEECDGRAVDTGTWVSEWGVYFGTDADFMHDMRQISMAGGNCVITAERKSTPSGRAWASGLMSTRNRFSQAYGRFEIRAKLPKGKGLWPAFWLLPQATFHGPPEIDVLEAWTNPLGTEPVDASSVSAAVHYGSSYDPDLFETLWYKGTDFTQDFHTYAVDWRPGEITWYVDGVERGRITENVPSAAMYLIVNLAVGSTWAGRPDASTPSPSQMLIDHMRVYE